jgi:predicted permease
VTGSRMIASARTLRKYCSVQCFLISETEMFFERSLALSDCPTSKNGVILTEENERTQRKICSTATLSTINFTRTVLASNTDLKTDINLKTEYSFGTAQ